MSTLRTYPLESPIVVTSPNSAVTNVVQRLAAALADLFATKKTGARGSTRLYYLNDHVMRDIGVSRADIGLGPAESFWRE